LVENRGDRMCHCSALGFGVREDGDTSVPSTHLLNVDLTAAPDRLDPRLDLALAPRPQTGVRLVTLREKIASKRPMIALLDNDGGASALLERHARLLPFAEQRSLSRRRTHPVRCAI